MKCLIKKTNKFRFRYDWIIKEMFLTYIFHWNTFNFNVNSDFFFFFLSSPCGSKKNFTNTRKKKTRDKLKKNLSVLFGLRLLWSSNHFVLCTFVFVLIFPRCQEYSFHRRNKDILPGKFSNFLFCLFFIFQLCGVVLPLRAECGKSVDRCILSLIYNWSID